MMLILDGNSEIDAQVMSSLCYMICLRHLISSRAATNRDIFWKRLISHHACASWSELPSEISVKNGEYSLCESLTIKCSLDVQAQ